MESIISVSIASKSSTFSGLSADKKTAAVARVRPVIEASAELTELCRGFAADVLDRSDDSDLRTVAGELINRPLAELSSNNATDKIISVINEKFDMLYGKKTGKGAIGEKLILNYLREQERYHDAQIEHIGSSTSESCDIRFVWRHLQALIEVKNYASAIPKEEIEKFQRDLAKNTWVNCAFFVSLDSKVIGPYHDLINFNYEVINNVAVPTVYFCIKENFAALDYAIAAMFNITQILTRRSEFNEEKSKILIDQFARGFEFALGRELSCKNQIAALEKNLTAARKDLASVEKYRNGLIAVNSQHEFIKLNHELKIEQPAVTEEQLIARILDKIQTENVRKWEEIDRIIPDSFREAHPSGVKAAVRNGIFARIFTPGNIAAIKARDPKLTRLASVVTSKDGIMSKTIYSTLLATMHDAEVAPTFAGIMRKYIEEVCDLMITAPVS